MPLGRWDWHTGSGVRLWHIASFRCAVEFGRYPGIADFGEPSARQIYSFTDYPSSRRDRDTRTRMIADSCLDRSTERDKDGK
jgi:hypothetical protein